MSKFTSTLAKDNKGVGIQAFPLVQGKINLTTGTFKAQLFHCVEAGNITLTWADGSTSTITCADGADFTCDSAVSVTIIDGIFHIA